MAENNTRYEPPTIRNRTYVWNGGDVNDESSYVLVSDDEIHRLALMHARVCENCEGDPHKIDGWTCHVCDGSGEELKP